MGNVDTTKREVEDHESKGNPHEESASESDLQAHESDESNPHNVTDDQTGASDALDVHASANNPHPNSASKDDVSEDAKKQALAAEIVLGGL